MKKELAILNQIQKVLASHREAGMPITEAFGEKLKSQIIAELDGTDKQLVGGMVIDFEHGIYWQYAIIGKDEKFYPEMLRG